MFMCKKNFLIVLLFFVSLVVYAQAPEKKVTLKFDQITLKAAVDLLSKSTGYVFSYDATSIDEKQLVSLNAMNVPIHVALYEMLKGTSIRYTIDGNQIILSSVVNQANPPTNSSRQKMLIKGTIVDHSGTPIIGATVLIRGTVNGTTSDIDGHYSIMAPKNSVLVYRYLGCQTVEKEVTSSRPINVTLEEENVNLKDVVVVAYGTQKKEDVVSSINSVSGDKLSMPTRSLNNMLAGKVAGILAVQRSGEPGNDNASFWIRGISSYRGGTSPLVLVDGVPRSMSDIDVDEIESFTVLKDAAATAVYGAEGANGVVLITTKRGRVQKTEITFNAQYSLVSPTRIPKLMPSYDYLSMWNEASWNDAGNPDWNLFNRPYSDEELEKYRSGVDRDLYPNSIWTDLLSKHTYNQRYTVNLRGGSERNRFFVSGAFYNEDGIFKSNPIEDYNANIGLKRYNLRSNVDMNITHTTKLSVDMSGQYKKNNDPGTSSNNIFKHIVLFPTHLVPMHWSDGTASITKTDADGRYNPYNLINYTGYMKSWSASIQSKVALSQKLDFITKGLSILGSVSFDAYISSVMSRTMSPDKYYVTGRDEEGNLIKVLKSSGTALGDASLSSTSGTKNIYLETQLNYNRTFGQKHSVQGLLVYNQREIQYQNVSGIALLPHRKQNVVFRSTYAYDGRYVVEGSFGVTGSENFAPGHRWGIFPAVGIAWNAHAEKFMNGVQDVINKLRFRASYGITGNDDTGSDRFIYRESLTNSGTAYLGLQAGANGGSANGYGKIYENSFAAPDLTWEKERKINVGLDLGMFRGRIEMTADYFTNRRSDILIERVTIPTATGFRNNPWQNYGITSNKGFDASLTLKHKIGDVNLSAIGNFTYAKNKIIEMDEVPQAYSWLAATGTSIGTPKVYIADGLFSNADFDITTHSDGSHGYTLKQGIPTYSSDVKPGDIKYKDLNGDGKINDSDMTYYSGLYPSNPGIIYGFGLNAEYKGFYAEVFFQGQAKASTNMKSNTSYFVPFDLGRDQSSARLEAADHWRANDPDNMNVLYPRLHTNEYSNNVLQSTWWYRSANFLRLKNVEIGYKFNKKWIRSLRMQSLQLYVQGTNVAVWDHIKLWDPEILNSGATYPICGTWTMGLNITF